MRGGALSSTRGQSGAPGEFDGHSGALTSSPTLAQDGALEKAQKYLDEQEYSSALIEAKNAVQAHPSDPQARILLGKIYLRVGDPKSAEAALVRAREPRRQRR